MRSRRSTILPCILCLLLAGCDEREEKAPPPAPSFTSLSAMGNPQNHAQATGQGDANLSPEELRTKQLAKLKDQQEKALKAQEKELKKKQKQKKDDHSDKPDGVKDPPLPLTTGDKKFLEVGREKEGQHKDKTRVPKEPGKTGSQITEITGPGRGKDTTTGSTVSVGGKTPGTIVNDGGIAERERPGQQEQKEQKRGFFERLFGKDKRPTQTIQAAAKGEEIKIPAVPGKKKNDKAGLVRTTPEMANVMSAVDQLDERSKQANPALRTPAEHHGTMSQRLQQVMAMKRLESATREQEQEPAPGEKKAEVVELGGGAAAGTNGATPQEGEPRALSVTVKDDEESAPLTPEETKAALDEMYRSGLASRDVVARDASFRHAALERRADAIPYLLDELKQNNILAALAVQCLAAIGQRTEDVESGLLHGLASREWAVRIACADALGRLRSTRAVQPLMEILKTEKNYEVRCAYVDALGAIGDRGALPALKARMEQKDEIEFVKSHAALALARLGDPSGRTHLVRNLDSTQPSLQIVGLTGSAQLGDPDVAGQLNAALESGYDEVWTAAVCLFPGLGAARALPLLRTRLEAPSEVLRRRAALAMGFLGSDEALPYVERAARAGGVTERTMACEVLANLGRSDKVPLLIEKLQDPHTSVRQIAAVSLARLNATEAVPALLDAARGAKTGAELPPGLRGAGPDAMERLIMLSCVRTLRGEKGELVITSLPNRSDNAWPEVERIIEQKQVELVTEYKFVDVVADGSKALGAVLRSPDGKERMYREGEHVASGFKVREIGLPGRNKDGTRISPYVLLMRGEERVLLAPDRPAEVEGKKKRGP